MLKHTGIFLAVFCVLPLSVIAQGNLAVYGNPGHPPMLDGDSQPITAGFVIEVGYFDANFDVDAAIRDVAALLDAWNGVGQLDVLVNESTDGGHFAEQLRTIPPEAEGQKIYLFVMKLSEGELPAAETVTEYGLFSSADARWYFSQTGNLTNLTHTITTSQVDEAPWGRVGEDHLALQPVDDGAEPLDWGAGSIELSQGWNLSPWFGLYWDQLSPWVYHLELAWLYRVGDSPAGFWMWSDNEQQWLWSGSAYFRWVWFGTDQEWRWWNGTVFQSVGE